MLQPIGDSFFSGAGLFDEGLKRGGCSIRESHEIDADASAVARANGHNSKTTDVTKKLVGKSEVDFMAFTYPCTRYSLAAEIHDTRTGDELYLHALRHVALSKVPVYVLENVPGMKKFPVVMEAMTRLPDYYVNVFCPVSTQMWLPQKRDRLIIIGSKKNFLWREPQSSRRVPLRDILEDEPQIEIPDYFYNCLKGDYRDRPIICDPDNGDIAPTCMAHYGKDLSTRAVKDKRFPKGVRPFTVREYARLQGLPDTYTFNCTPRLAYKFIGNGVSLPVGEWVGQELVRYFNQNN